MSWFKRESGDYESGSTGPEPIDSRRVRTDGLWVKFLGCRQAIWKADLAANLNVCQKCQHHFKMGARQRIEDFADKNGGKIDAQEFRNTCDRHFAFVEPVFKAEDKRRAVAMKYGHPRAAFCNGLERT